MTNKRAIVIGVSAIAAVLVVAVLAYGFGSDKMVKQEQGQKGNGMAEKLEFKNPVTFELLDKDGNVVSRTVVYNAITDWGRNYINAVLVDPEVSVLPINRMEFSSPDALVDNGGVPVTLYSSWEYAQCYINDSNQAECVALFWFDGYQPGQGVNELGLASGEKISIGYYGGEEEDAVFIPYFEIDTFTIPVSGNTIYYGLQITWTIIVE